MAHTLRGLGFDASEDGTGRGTPLTTYRQRGFGDYVSSSSSTVKQRDNKDATDLIAFSCKDHGNDCGDTAPTLRGMNSDGSHQNGGGQVAVAFAQNQRDEVRTMDVAGALASEPGMKQQSYVCGWSEELTAHENVGATIQRGGQGGRHDGVMDQTMTVRRLTPRECERLQGFPDDWTRIPWRGKPPEDCPDGPRYKALGNSMACNCMRWIGQRIEMVDRIVEEAG